jgi:hypothetical protein
MPTPEQSAQTDSALRSILRDIRTLSDDSINTHTPIPNALPSITQAFGAMPPAPARPSGALRSQAEFFMGGVVPVEPKTPADECGICPDALSSDVVEIVACGHQFHLRCVLGWFQSGAAASNTCPYDRVKLYENPSSNSNTFNDFLGPSRVPRATRLGDFADLDNDFFARGNAYWSSLVPPPPTVTAYGVDTRPSGAGASRRRHFARSLDRANRDPGEDNPFAQPGRSRSASPPSDADVGTAFGFPYLRSSAVPQGFTARRNALVPPSSPSESTVAGVPDLSHRSETMLQSGDEVDLPGAAPFQENDIAPDNLSLRGTRPEATNMYFDPQRPHASPTLDLASLVPESGDWLSDPRISGPLQMLQCQIQATRIAAGIVEMTEDEVWGTQT